MNNEKIFAEQRRFAKKLLDSNYRFVPTYEFEKYPKGYPDYLKLSEDKSYIENLIKTNPNITGVAMLAGYPRYGQPDRTINFIDIDIYDQEAKQRIIDVIRDFGKERNIHFYEEKTVSGGYHFAWRSSDINPMQQTVKFWTQTCKLSKDGRRKPHEIVICINRLLLISPGYAKSKLDCDGKLASESGKKPIIGKYEKAEDSIDLLNCTIVKNKDISDLCSHIDFITDCMNVGELGEKKASSSTRGNNNWNHEFTVDEEKRFKKRADTVKKRLKVSIDYLDKRLKQEKTFEQAFTLLGLDWRGRGVNTVNEIRFFSLAASSGDGTHTGAQFYRGDTYKKDKYLVADEHVSYCGGGLRYVAWYGNDTLWNKVFKYCQSICNLNDRIKILPSRAGTDVKKFNITDYITDEIKAEIYNEILFRINDCDHIPDIVFKAPTGCGKTVMFCQWAIERKDNFIIALPYTSQVEQLKDHYQGTPWFQGLCGGDSGINPGTTSVFTTYDKLELFFNVNTNGGHNLKDFILVIDEAHNIIEQLSIRKDVLSNVSAICNHVKAIIRVSATPYPIDFNKIDLFISINKFEILKENYYRYECGENILKKALTHLVQNHKPNTITVMLHNSIKGLNQIRYGLKCLYPHIECHVLDSSVRELNHYEDVYDDWKLLRTITKYGRLRNDVQNLFINGGILLSTTVIADGVNINDDNIGNIYTVTTSNPTDYIQFINRFREGCKSVNIFCGGNANNELDYGCTQEEYLSYVLNEADKQKEYSKYMDKQEYKVKLSSLAWFVDNHTKEIKDEWVLHSFSRIEWSRLQRDTEYFKNMFELSDFEYGVKVINYDYKKIPFNIGNAILEHGKKVGESEKDRLLNELKCIYGYDKWIYVLDKFARLEGSEFKKNIRFERFAEKISTIANRNRNTNSSAIYYPHVDMIKNMKNILFSVCVGLILKIDDVNRFVEQGYSIEKLKIMLNTYHNLKTMKNAKKYKQAVSKDIHLLRLQKLTVFMKRYIVLPTLEKEDNKIILLPKTLSDVQQVLREKYNVPYPIKKNDKTFSIGTIKKDMETIIDLETKHFPGNSAYYLIGKFHTLKDCHGWETGKARTPLSNIVNINLANLT